MWRRRFERQILFEYRRHVVGEVILGAGDVLGGDDIMTDGFFLNFRWQ